MKYLLVFIGVAFSLLSCGNKERKAERESSLKEIRIGYIGGHFHPIIVKEQGWFEDEFGKDSIKVILQRFDYGPPEIESFISGNLDFGSIGDQPAIVGWANGLDIKAIGNLIGGYKLYGIAVGNNSNIQSLKDLKNKKVAVAIGTVYQHLLHQYLVKENLTEKDINVVNLKFSESITALSSGNVDAVVVGEPFLSIIESKKIGKVLHYSDGYKYATLPLIASGEFAKKHPDIVNRLLRLYQKANQWTLDNKQKTIEIILRETPYISKEVAENLYGKSLQTIALNDTVKEAFKETYDFLRQSNIIRNDKDIATFYDESFLTVKGGK